MVCRQVKKNKMDKKRRNAKVSQRHQDVMCDFIAMNKKMQVKGDTLTDWQDLSDIINEIPGGARKPAEQWRRSFIEWKSKTKKKARDITISQNKTGGGPGYVELTDIEKKTDISMWEGISFR
ncbi:unnamed protein product [Psylliodes chrysocephalus]|uniref:Regulatory protein zeste n=1 Tax=Psylliodes chrysocephalus TaxID=3402493 RepID=A0A9P0D6M3_9CUCU|nr:unnamed protein product [Psylliodes chrysocephala]